MVSIVIKDSKNRTYEVLGHLRAETELLIIGNVHKINSEINPDIHAQAYWDGLEEDLKKRGYQMSQGLYDKLIIAYNLTHQDLLTRWK